MRKNSGGKRQAWYQLQVITGKRRSLAYESGAYESDHSGVRPVKFTGQLPEWSDS